MPLIRGTHNFDGKFTQVPNTWVRDNRLTLKARGLLTLLMSHSPGWSVSINSLIQENLEGRDSLKAAVAELEEFGYLKREQSREDGKFSEAVWTTNAPWVGKPLTGKPLTEKPLTENPHPKNTNNKKTNNKNTIESPVENPKKGAHRLPKDFEPSAKSIESKRKEYPWVDIEFQTEKFKNHWWASASPTSLKKDWQAAWRMWIMNAADWSKPEPSKAKHKFTMED